MCSSIISATSISFIRCSTHCSGAGSLVICRLLDVDVRRGEGMQVGDGQLACTRYDAVDIARRWFGRRHSTNDAIEYVHLRQPGLIWKWCADMRTRVTPKRNAAQLCFLAALLSLLLTCRLQRGVDRPQSDP